MVFIFVSTELTATLLLSPAGARTLATEVWANTSSLAFAAAAPGRPPHSFRFQPACAGGKPKPHGLHGFDVSLTHCNGYAAAAAVASGGRIGIDAEPFARGIEPELIEAIAAPTERAAIGYPAALWTLKEALAKAEGSGLALDLARIETDPRALRLVSAPSSFGNPITWRLERHWDAGFVVVIAFGPPAGR